MCTSSFNDTNVRINPYSDEDGDNDDYTTTTITCPYRGIVIVIQLKTLKITTLR